jgi:hypothetical protein
MTNSTPHGDRTDQDHPRYVIGVDFGSLSGRAVVVRVNDGHELASAVYEYPHAVMDTALATTGQPLPPEWALQDAEDYIGVLRTAVPQAVRFAGIDPQQVIGIGTDFTACTMVPTLADGTPLSALDDLRSRPHAYVKLWKHHAAQPQADRINATARETGESWLARYGGLMSSEWEFAKGLQIFEEDREIYDRMQRWVEGADWITLTAQVFPQNGYPFHLDTAVHYALHNDRLAVTHTVTNIGAVAAPVAIGAHPFLTIGDVPTDQLTLTVAAQRHITVDERLNPIGSRLVAGTPYDLRAGRVVADLDLDDAWSDLDIIDGGSTHSLTAPDGRTVSLWADDQHNYLQVFTTRRYPDGGRHVTAVAVEPMTAPADAFNSGEGLKWRAPRQQWSVSWAIRYDDQPPVRDRAMR